MRKMGFYVSSYDARMKPILWSFNKRYLDFAPVFFDDEFESNGSFSNSQLITKSVFSFFLNLKYK